MCDVAYFRIITALKCFFFSSHFKQANSFSLLKKPERFTIDVVVKDYLCI